MIRFSPTGWRSPWLPLLLALSVLTACSNPEPVQPPVVLAETDGPIRRMVADQTYLYLAGDFTRVNTRPRAGLAAIELETGVVVDWFPEVKGRVLDMDLRGGILFLAGDERFSIGRDTRWYLAGVSTSSRQFIPWNPNPNGPVYALEAANEKVYVGGAFDSILNNPQPYAAALNLQPGGLESWNPEPNAPVRHLEVDENQQLVYLAGDFTSLNNLPRSGLGAARGRSGAVLAFNSGLDWDTVSALRIGARGLWAGGWLQGDTLGQQPLAVRLDTFSGQVLDTWQPQFGSALARILDFAFQGDTTFVGGYFTGVDGLPINHLIALDSALAPLYEPFTLNDTVYAVLAADSSLLVGGKFSRVDNEAQSGFARRPLPYPSPAESDTAN